MELKLLILKCFQSRKRAFNRTTMELKLEDGAFAQKVMRAFNRTTMELKPGRADGRRGRALRF